MAVVLNLVEIRVLGALIEKSLASPAYYPMTLNAIVAACNQKNNREPVMNLSEGEVAAALYALERWQLVGKAEPGRNSRVNRFRHRVEERFGWNAPQRALMAELMLRGPQTIGELRGNASRMHSLEALDYVRELLSELERADPPMVVELPRRPGQSATRFAQLFGGPVGSPDSASRPAIVAAAGCASAGVDPVAARIERLEQEVAALRAELTELRAGLGGGSGATSA